MKQKPPVVISGSIAIDRIMKFDGRYRDQIYPEKLDSLSVSVFLETMNDAHGGVGANIAYSLALLGDQPILLGSVGPDGLVYMEKLARCGVNIQHLYESQLPTSSFNVITDSDQNQIAGFYPGAMFDSDTLGLEPWKNADPIVVVAPHDPKAMKRQIEECRRWKLHLFYDIGQQANNTDGDDLAFGVRAAEILILNDYEMAILSNKTGLSEAEIKRIVPVVITTLGKNGSVIEGRTVPQPIRIGVAKPSRVADPTGAGDAYRSGFLYGQARGWPLKDSAQLGAVCATYAIETMGTQTHTFTPTQVAKRYRDTFKQAPPKDLVKE